MTSVRRRLRVSIDSPLVVDALARFPARTVSPFVMDCILRALRDPDARRAWGHYLEDVPLSAPAGDGDGSGGAPAATPVRACDEAPDLSFLGPLAASVSV